MVSRKNPGETAGGVATGGSPPRDQAGLPESPLGKILSGPGTVEFERKLSEARARRSELQSDGASSAQEKSRNGRGFERQLAQARARRAEVFPAGEPPAPFTARAASIGLRGEPPPRSAPADSTLRSAPDAETRSAPVGAEWRRSRLVAGASAAVAVLCCGVAGAVFLIGSDSPDNEVVTRAAPSPVRLAAKGDLTFENIGPETGIMPQGLGQGNFDLDGGGAEISGSELRSTPDRRVAVREPPLVDRVDGPPTFASNRPFTPLTSDPLRPDVTLAPAEPTSGTPDLRVASISTDWDPALLSAVAARLPMPSDADHSRHNLGVAEIIPPQPLSLISAVPQAPSASTRADGGLPAIDERPHEAVAYAVRTPDRYAPLPVTLAGDVPAPRPQIGPAPVPPSAAPVATPVSLTATDAAPATQDSPERVQSGRPEPVSGCPSLDYCGGGGPLPTLALFAPEAGNARPLILALADLGFRDLVQEPAALPVAQGQIRYFRDTDAAAAATIARETGYDLLDMTWYRPLPIASTIEVRVPG